MAKVKNAVKATNPKYVEHFADNDFGMELYDLAMDIREVLGLAGYDDFKTENAD